MENESKQWSVMKKEFQAPIDGGYKVSNNETGGKSVRQVYVKYFE